MFKFQENDKDQNFNLKNYFTEKKDKVESYKEYYVILINYKHNKKNYWFLLVKRLEWTDLKCSWVIYCIFPNISKIKLFKKIIFILKIFIIYIFKIKSPNFTFGLNY